jgi:hypothetical protein
MDEEKAAIVSDDHLPSSPTHSHVIELATPSHNDGHYSYQLPNGSSSPLHAHLEGQREDDAEDNVETVATKPFAQSASANASRQSEVVSVPTGPAQLIENAISTVSSLPSSTSDVPSSSHTSTHLTTSARTTSIKSVNPTANVKKTNTDKGDIEVGDEDKIKGTAGQDIDPSIALDAIPSLDDYVRYIDVLQKDWRDAPTMDIVFQHLSYNVKVASDETSIPSISKSFLDFFKWITFQQPKPVNLAVFNDCTGVIPHGKMTLVLAPPGAGKSQFLKTLAGRMRNEKRVTGDLWYNGLTADEQLKAGQYIEKLCGLVAQGDVHMVTTSDHTPVTHTLPLPPSIPCSPLPSLCCCC